ncbi:MAG: hypothetical protein LAT68_17115 [Cyclobacteriaceae bacterium]|nr:hypothetical protein [Cyclobacteriaceae bacterium]
MEFVTSVMESDDPMTDVMILYRIAEYIIQRGGVDRDVLSLFKALFKAANSAASDTYDDEINERLSVAFSLAFEISGGEFDTEL